MLRQAASAIPATRFGIQETIQKHSRQFGDKFHEHSKVPRQYELMLDQPGKNIRK
jgi:hypothetical protein